MSVKHDGKVATLHTKLSDTRSIYRLAPIYTYSTRHGFDRTFFIKVTKTVEGFYWRPCGVNGYTPGEDVSDTAFETTSSLFNTLGYELIEPVLPAPEPVKKKTAAVEAVKVVDGGRVRILFKLSEPLKVSILTCVSYSFLVSEGGFLYLSDSLGRQWERVAKDTEASSIGAEARMLHSIGYELQDG